MNDPLLVAFEYLDPDGVRVQARGYLVPDTDETLIADERWPAHWRITHRPTGCAVMPPYKAKLSVREQAMAFAQRFHHEAKALGADFTATDWTIFRATLFGDLGIGEREKFWERVI